MPKRERQMTGVEVSILDGHTLGLVVSQHAIQLQIVSSEVIKLRTSQNVERVAYCEV